MTMTEAATDTMQEAVTQQVADIRERMKTLMDEHVTPAIVEAGGQVDGLVRAAADKVKEQTDVMSGQFRQRPITSVLLAACLGFVLGRVLS